MSLSFPSCHSLPMVPERGALRALVDGRRDALAYARAGPLPSGETNVKQLRAHPDYLDPLVPQQAQVGELRLEVLGPDITREDFDAVMESADKLEGLFGDSWPRGLTLDENTIDLAWHLREFEAARSFAWVIRDAHGRYLGCCYLFPTLGERGRGRGWIWFRTDGLDADAEREATIALADWMRSLGPEGAELELHTPG
jgi:hypothetical protein